MSALTKAQMVDRLYEEHGFNKREAKEIVEAFFEEIRAALERGDPVRLSGFGNFMLRDKAERPGRNPRSGAPAPVSARRVVTFRPSRRLRARVAAYEPPATD